MSNSIDESIRELSKNLFEQRGAINVFQSKLQDFLNAQKRKSEAEKENGKITLSAFKDKQALAKTKLTIINPQTWEKTKFTNENGQTSFTPTGKGLYLVELEWIDTNPGTFKGKDYQTIRYKSEMTFVID